MKIDWISFNCFLPVPLTNRKKIRNDLYQCKFYSQVEIPTTPTHNYDNKIILIHFCTCGYRSLTLSAKQFSSLVILVIKIVFLDCVSAILIKPHENLYAKHAETRRDTPRHAETRRDTPVPEKL